MQDTYNRKHTAQLALKELNEMASQGKHILNWFLVIDTVD